VALLLRKQGISRIRPLAGGFQAWRDRGLPVEPVAIPAEAA
jgi:rhodanese-related sulfurtransferase